MGEWMWISVLGVIAIITYRYVYRWRQMQQAGKKADKLLAHIVKAKDSHRR